MSREVGGKTRVDGVPEAKSRQRLEEIVSTALNGTEGSRKIRNEGSPVYLASKRPLVMLRSAV